MEKLIALIPALPFLGFLINGMGFRKIPKGLAGAIGSLAALGSFLLSIFLLVQFKSNGSQPISTSLWTWISGSFYSVSFSFHVDQLTLLMLMVVTGIGFLIHVFSIGYMHHDEGFGKFFAFLNLFLFSMLVLVMGGNLLMTFIGWEGVGLCSYLLIGFWNKTDAFNAAAKKAFVMNRIGDLGFLLGIFIILFKVGTIQYSELSSLITSSSILSDPLIQWAGVCLFIGAMGKSAQIPLFTWLPDAMAGPTPVSALIHAATMVTSGIYLVIRMNGLFSGLPHVQEFILWIGLATAILGALIGTSQNDIKKVLAYSTVSQLGFMFVALGVGAYTAAIFHVITHAFFKALLFLGAGSVIHGLHEEQDIRKMGGLKKLLPVTYFTFFMANLAIAGIPPFSGFFSKDEILAHTYAENKVAFVLLLVTAGITAFYMFRLFFLVFYNEYRGKLSSEKIHDAPASMAIPLIILALLSVIGGFIGIPEVFHAPHLLAEFLAPVLKPSEVLATVGGKSHHLGHSEEWMVMGLSVLVALSGIGIAAKLYLSDKKVPSEAASESGLGRILEGKFFIDEIYNTLIAKPIVFIGNLFSVLVDILMINLLVELVGSATSGFGSILRRTQVGKVGIYALLMLSSIIVFALYFFFSKF
jgi:NADH-quinone oxidoreductase subunit L